MAIKKLETLDGIFSPNDVVVEGNVVVDTDTLYVDSTNSRVGFNRTDPQHEVDVTGTTRSDLFLGIFDGDGTAVTNVNAETLDTINSDQFLRSDVNDAYTSGNFQFSGSSVTVNAGNFRLSDNIPLRLGSTDTPGVNMTFDGTRLQVGGSNVNFNTTVTISGLNYPTGDGTNGQVLTTDGSGNLSFTSPDSTTLDGLDSTQFLRSDVNDTFTGPTLTINNALVASGLTYPTGDGTNGQVLTTDGSGNLSFTSPDSTTLDGLDSTQFLRSDVNDTFTGPTLTINNTLVASGLTYPTGDGSPGQVMVTDGYGNLSFVNKHDDTSSQSSVNNSDGVVIQDVTLDGFGHVTNLNSVNLDTRFLREVNLGRTEGGSSFTIVNSGGTNTTIRDATTGRAGLVTTGDQTWGGIKTAPDFVANSDRTLKENIEELSPELCLQTIMSLKPSSYTWKETGEQDTGLIAQEVQKVLSHRVHETNEGTLAVSYSKLVTELIGAVQSLNQRIEELESKTK